MARPTRRGLALVAAVVAGLVLARLHGVRSLGAIVFPGVVALAAAFVAVQSVDPPELTRVLPPPGQRGEAGTVGLVLDTDATLMTIHDRLPAGLHGDSTVETLGDGRVAYDVRYVARGDHSIGPARVTVRDVLGLAVRQFRLAETDTLTVYPRVVPLSPGGRNRVLAAVGSGRAPEREEFDHLREYERGDSLRDVHWKSSARHDELVVTEYVATDVAERVVILAETDAGAGGTADGVSADSAPADGDPADGAPVDSAPADRMAEATASLADALLSAGVPVTVHTPTGTVTATVGDRDALLSHLARTTAGRATSDAGAAIHVRAGDEGVSVRLGDVETTFEELRDAGTTANDPAAGVSMEVSP